MSEGIAVVNLKIKNFMSITDVEIKPAQVNVIVGANEQGKTTILKAIESAAKNQGDGNLVRRGEEQAEIIIELKNEYVVDRKIKADGSNSVKLTRGFGEDLEKLSSPQGLIDRLFDNVNFNPIDLLDPKKRNESIMGAITLSVTAERLAEELGIDVEDLPPLDYDKHGLQVLDQAHKYFYQRRAEASKDAADKKKKYDVNNAEMKSFSEPSETKDQLAAWKLQIDQDQTALTQEREKLKAQNTQIENENSKIDGQEKTLADYDKQISDAQTKIDDLQKKIAEHQSDIDKINQSKAGYLAAVGKIERKGLIDFSAIDERQDLIDKLKSKYDVKVAEHATYESNLKQVKMIDSMRGEYEAALEFANNLSAKVELLKSELKKKMLAEIDMPIEGLEFIDGAFYLNGNTIDLLSSSAALKLAIAIARKLAKRTKLICIDGAEMIDDENFLALSTEIKDDGFTYFITRVGDPLKVDGQKVFKMENGTASEV